LCISKTSLELASRISTGVHTCTSNASVEPRHRHVKDPVRLVFEFLQCTTIVCTKLAYIVKFWPQTVPRLELTTRRELAASCAGTNLKVGVGAQVPCIALKKLSCPSTFWLYK